MRGVTGDNYAVNTEFILSEVVNEFENFSVVGYAEILSGFISFDIAGVNADNNFKVVFKLGQKFDFCVFVKTGENTFSVLVINQLPAEFYVEPLTVVYSF